MFQVTRTVAIEAAHRLMRHGGQCQNLHGHSYKFVVTVESESLDDQGMVIDFSFLNQFMDLAFGNLDHAVILEKNDPLVPTMEALNLRLVTYDEAPTAEAMARSAYNKLSDIVTKFNSSIKVSSITVYETEKNCATVRF